MAPTTARPASLTEAAPEDSESHSEAFCLQTRCVLESAIQWGGRGGANVGNQKQRRTIHLERNEQLATKDRVQGRKEGGGMPDTSHERLAANVEHNVP